MIVIHSIYRNNKPHASVEQLSSVQKKAVDSNSFNPRVRTYNHLMHAHSQGVSIDTPISAKMSNKPTLQRPCCDSVHGLVLETPIAECIRPHGLSVIQKMRPPFQYPWVHKCKWRTFRSQPLIPFYNTNGDMCDS